MVIKKWKIVGSVRKVVIKSAQSMPKKVLSKWQQNIKQHAQKVKTYYFGCEERRG